jgi:lactoylglutathione lyase
MATPHWISDRLGAFAGSTQLWLDPAAAAELSPSTATLASRAGGVAFELAYEWSFRGRAAAGLLTAHVNASGRARASWTDSWHLHDALMACEGTADASSLSVSGAYAAPPGPDWGWRVALRPIGADGVRLEMFNRAPDGSESPAVACDYQRQAAPLGTADLGAFSVSLTVADLAASESFYAALGFERAGGDASQGWTILRNGRATIGLFRGMFERNLLTFNPGWTPDATARLTFEDVRSLHARALAAGLQVAHAFGLEGAGPASFVLVDPDGNPVLIDQHVPEPTVHAVPAGGS